MTEHEWETGKRDDDFIPFTCRNCGLEASMFDPFGEEGDAKEPEAPVNSHAAILVAASVVNWRDCAVCLAALRTARRKA